MQKFSEVLKKNEEQKYGELAQRVKESFARKFWMEEKTLPEGCNLRNKGRYTNSL